MPGFYATKSRAQPIALYEQLRSHIAVRYAV